MVDRAGSSGSAPSHWRGMARLLALASHLLRGLAIVYLRFPRMDGVQRRAAVQQWAAEAVARCGLTLRVQGSSPAAAPGRGVLLVANHISWADIPALHAVHFCRFVSKAEVQHWPVLGRLADAAGTLYLQRASRRDAYHVLHRMAECLQAGDVLAVFPEGTTSDGRTLLPFHANLLQAAISVDAPIQPVALRFVDAQGQTSLLPCYIGDESLLTSLWRTLCAQGLAVQIAFGDAQHANGRTRQQWAHDLRDTIAKLREKQ